MGNISSRRQWQRRRRRHYKKKTEKGGKKPQRNAHAQHAMSKERPKVVAKPQRKAKPRLL